MHFQFLQALTINRRGPAARLLKGTRQTACGQLHGAWLLGAVAGAITLSSFVPGLAVSARAASTAVCIEDHFDGARWRFSMQPKFPRAEKCRGSFRVSNDQIFQKDRPADAEMSKLVGTNHPDGRKTRIVLKELRVFPESNPTGPRAQQTLKGTAILTMDELGEWSGRFIDDKGRHWDFKCSRVAE